MGGADGIHRWGGGRTASERTGDQETSSLGFESSG